MTTRIARSLGASAVVLAAAASLSAGVASANAADAQAPAPLSAADLAAAAKAATTPGAQKLATELAASTGGSATPGTESLRSTTSPVQINLLSADFVRNGTGPVASAGYVATASTVDGKDVTIWSMRTAGGWKAVNAASGEVEKSMQAKAAGAPMFREPQINAWYALRGDQVVPLNAAAQKAVGQGMSLDAYQQRVHRLYADKLPGSDYATSGMGGGGRAASTASTASTASSTSPVLPAAFGGVGVIALLVAGGLALRGRRRIA